MGSLESYPCIRRLSDVGVPPVVRAESVHRLHPELKSPVRVELEVHRQPRFEAAASPSHTATAAAAPSAPLVMGIAGRTCEYCQQWLQDRASGAGAAAGAGGAAAVVPPFVTHMYFSADGVPPLHAVMTDSYGEWSSVPHDEALYLLLAVDSCKRAFRGPDGRISCESCVCFDVAAVRAIGRLAYVPVRGALRCRSWLLWFESSIWFRGALFPSASLAGNPPYEAVLGLGKVWVNGRLVVDPPPAAYATREGDAHPSGIDPASVRLAELRMAAMAAAIGRGASKAEAVASGQAAVAAAMAVGEGREARAAPVGEGGGSGSAAAGGGGAGSAEVGSAGARGSAP